MGQALKCNKCGRIYTDKPSIDDAIQNYWHWKLLNIKDNVDAESISGCPNIMCGGNLELLSGENVQTLKSKFEVEFEEYNPNEYDADDGDFNSYQCPFCAIGIVTIGQVFSVTFPSGVLASVSQGQQKFNHFVCDKCSFRILIPLGHDAGIFQKMLREKKLI